MRAPVAEAVVTGGLACGIVPQVVDAVTAMNPPMHLLVMVVGALVPARRAARISTAAALHTE